MVSFQYDLTRKLKYICKNDQVLLIFKLFYFNMPMRKYYYCNVVLFVFDKMLTCYVSSRE